MSANPNRSAALNQAITAALPPFQHSEFAIQNSPPRATPRNPAPQIPHEMRKSNPPQSAIRNPQSPILKPLQLSAARLLLAGHSITATAAALNIHRYTITRWKKSPAFQSELRRQTDSLARHTAQQSAASRRNPTLFSKNEPMRHSGPPRPALPAISSPSSIFHQPSSPSPAQPSAAARHNAQQSPEQLRKSNPFLYAILYPTPANKPPS